MRATAWSSLGTAKSNAEAVQWYRKAPKKYLVRPLGVPTLVKKIGRDEQCRNYGRLGKNTTVITDRNYERARP